METKELSQKNWDKAPVRVERIDDLKFRWNLYPRKKVNPFVVRKYANAMDAGDVFPTVKVAIIDDEKIIVDGAHRVEACKLRQIEYVDCSELPFGSEAELFAEAVKLNSSHGKTFFRYEITKIISRLKKYKFSVDEIVSLTHVPASEIHREAMPITELTGPSGKKVYCDVQKVDCDGQPVTRELLQFKNALMLIRDVARKGCIPKDDAYFKDLVQTTLKALREMGFNG